VLEVGAGTGKATPGLASVGLDVTCVEPDPEMAAVLARRVAGEPRVRVTVAAFESFSADEAYDGVVSAQAWHWTDPLTRMDRAASCCGPEGSSGCSGTAASSGSSTPTPRSRRSMTNSACTDRTVRPSRSQPRLRSPRSRTPATWPADEIAAHPAFEYQGTSLFPWQQDYTAAQFADLLDSTSWFRVLEPVVRTRLLGAITGMLQDRFGGVIGLDWSTQCYNARRLG
jgi:SAM-dependent methyltransferase